MDAQQVEILKQQILVIQTAFLGDCLLTIPFLLRLSEKFPETEIDVITTPATESVFSALICIRKVILFDKRGEHKTLLKTLRFGEGLTSEGYSAIYTLHRSFRSTILALFIKSKKRIGFANASLSFLFDERIEYKTGVHEVERNLAFLYETNFELPQKPEVFLRFSERTISRVDQWIADLSVVPDKIIAIAPGSVWETKRYPVNYFAEIAQKLAAKGYTIVIIGSQAEKNLAESICNGDVNKNIINLCGKMEILESLLFLSKIKMIVCNDSAPAHLGYLAGTRVLLLYCSTVPEFGFFPYGKNGSFMSVSAPCKPCGIHGYKSCPTGTYECALKLEPSLVLKKIESEFL